MTDLKNPGDLTHLPREQVLAAIRMLGVDPEKVSAVHMDGDTVTFSVGVPIAGDLDKEVSA